MSKFAALIERLEKETGPDREIDCHIHRAFGGSVALWHGKMVPEDSAGVSVPAYTGSIDAAVALRPPNWSWRVGNLPNGRAFADLGTQPSLQCVEAASPAIALVIAALRAREGGMRG